MLSALVDGRRVVSFYILAMGVEATHIVELLTRCRVGLVYKRCEHLAKAPEKHDRPVVDAVGSSPHDIALAPCPAELALHVSRALFPPLSCRASVAYELDLSTWLTLMR